MGILVEQAKRVVGVLEQMQPGQQEVIEVEGYVLAQGVISAFVREAIKDSEEAIAFENFKFDWDNDEAQRMLGSQIALTITRLA